MKKEQDKKKGLPSEAYLVGHLLDQLGNHFGYGANNSADFWKSQGRCRQLMEMIYQVRSAKR